MPVYTSRYLCCAIVFTRKPTIPEKKWLYLSTRNLMAHSRPDKSYTALKTVLCTSTGISHHSVWDYTVAKAAPASSCQGKQEVGSLFAECWQRAIAACSLDHWRLPGVGLMDQNKSLRLALARKKIKLCLGLHFLLCREPLFFFSLPGGVVNEQ